jgi:hypothetical protein
MRKQTRIWSRGKRFLSPLVGSLFCGDLQEYGDLQENSRTQRGFETKPGLTYDYPSGPPLFSGGEDAPDDVADELFAVFRPGEIRRGDQTHAGGPIFW